VHGKNLVHVVYRTLVFGYNTFELAFVLDMKDCKGWWLLMIVDDCWGWW
jgi:hypothetical protein